MFKSIVSKTVTRQFDSSYNLTDSEFDAKFTTMVATIQGHLSTVEGLASELFRLAYARCFTSEKRQEQKQAVADMRDRIEESLGKRFSRAFGYTASELDFCLPTQSELEQVNWFAGEGVQKKKAEKYGVKELISRLEKRSKKIKGLDSRPEGANEELKALALCLETLKGGSKE